LDSKDTANVINREVTNTDAVNWRHNDTKGCQLWLCSKGACLTRCFDQLSKHYYYCDQSK